MVPLARRNLWLTLPDDSGTPADASDPGQPPGAHGEERAGDDVDPEVVAGGEKRE